MSYIEPTSYPPQDAPNPYRQLPPEAIALATRFYDAARLGRMDIFQQALPRGLPANMTNDKGDTLVMLAAYHGHTPLLRLLIQHGADPNRLNDRGQSPLSGAVFKMEKEVIEVLLAAGADPEYGMPNAVECIDMFKQRQWVEPFANALGRGKMSNDQAVQETQVASRLDNTRGDEEQGRMEKVYKEDYADRMTGGRPET